MNANKHDEEIILETALCMLVVNSYKVIYRAFFLSKIDRVDSL